VNGIALLTAGQNEITVMECFSDVDCGFAYGGVGRA
jgi:hypothetical protein